MKYNVKNYLSLSALVAASALMVSCDDDVTLSTPGADELAEAAENAKNKPIAAPVITQLPLQSLKIAFFNGEGGCFATGFNAGEEIEIDFDATNATGTADTSADAVGDYEFEGGVVRDIDVDVLGINSNPAQTVWTIDTIREINGGDVLLTNLTFEALNSDQRSVTGRVTASGVLEVNINQDTANVISDAPLGNYGTVDGETVVKVTFYEDVAGNDAEVLDLAATEQYEDQLQSGNIAISLQLENDCVVNYVWDRTDAEAASGGFGLTAAGAPNIVAAIDAADPAALDVAPANNQIAPNSDLLHLIAGEGGFTLEGTYRLDFDSSLGENEGTVDVTGANR